MYKIDNLNRNSILLKYIQSIINKSSITELKEMSSNFLLKEKEFLSDYDLEEEIMRHSPSIFIDQYLSENKLRSEQYQQIASHTKQHSLILE